MKLINISVLLLAALYGQAFAFTTYNRPLIINTPSGRIIIPGQRTEPELKGQGIVFNTNVTVYSDVTKDETTKEEKVVKRYEAWIRGCGIVKLPPEGKESLNVKTGDRVELRFERAGSCNPIDWKKF